MGKGKCYWDTQMNEGLKNIICKYKSELNRREKGLFKPKKKKKNYELVMNTLSLNTEMLSLLRAVLEQP